MDFVKNQLQLLKDEQDLDIKMYADLYAQYSPKALSAAGLVCTNMRVASIRAGLGIAL